MDLATLDLRKQAEEGVEVQLRHPATGESLELWVRVLGRDSQKYRQYIIDEANRQAKNRTRVVAADELQRRLVADAVALTIGWRAIEVDGKALAYSEGAAAELYTRFDWIREQVVEAAGDRANFLPKSAPIS